MSLTKNEVRFLRALRKMEQTQEQFGHVRIAKQLGYRSVGTVWQYLQQLERKGYLQPGSRLAYVNCPTVSKEGLKLLRRAA